jgi:hypothetical protein
MLLLVVVNRLILFIRFYFRLLESGPFLQWARGRMCPLLSALSDWNGSRDGRG